MHESFLSIAIEEFCFRLGVLCVSLFKTFCYFNLIFSENSCLINDVFL